MCFEVFQMSIPCTGRDTGIAGLELGLQIFNKNGRPIRGSPMKLKLKKQCNAIGQSNYLQLRRKSAFCITFVFFLKDLIRHGVNWICFDFIYDCIKLLLLKLTINLISFELRFDSEEVINRN